MNEAKQEASYARLYAKMVTKYRRELNAQYMKAIEPLMIAMKFMSTPQDVLASTSSLVNIDVLPTVSKLYKEVGLAFIKRSLGIFREMVNPKKAVDLNRIPEIPNFFDYEFQWSDELTEYMLKESAIYLRTVNQETKDAAVKIVREITQGALDKGWSIDKTMEELNKGIPKKWRKELWRAERIARTEVLSAANKGDFIAAEASGLDLNKKWKANLDGRERETHREQNGKELPINEPFLVGGISMTGPGDPKGGASERINCRCRLVWVRVD